MGLLKRKPDPISDRSRALKAEIDALEAQILKLSSKSEKDPSQPRVRSTALPHGQSTGAAAVSLTSQPAARAPVFETIDHGRIAPPGSPEMTPAHYNDLGVRKYDLAATWRRIRNHFQGPAASNPKLVSYLAAGTIKGLRPLRYEKRVARNRFLWLFLLLLLVISGLFAAFIRNY